MMNNITRYAADAARFAADAADTLIDAYVDAGGYAIRYATDAYAAFIVTPLIHTPAADATDASLIHKSVIRTDSLYRYARFFAY